MIWVLLAGALMVMLFAAVEFRAALRSLVAAADGLDDRLRRLEADISREFMDVR